MRILSRLGLWQMLPVKQTRADDLVRPKVVAVAFPDRYGAGRIFVDSVRAIIESRMDVTVCVPENGPMVSVLEKMGVEVLIYPFWVLRKGDLRPVRLVRLGATFPKEAWRLRQFLLKAEADALYVNGLPFAVWFAAGWLARLPILGHLHEAEDQLPKIVSLALTFPLNAARQIVANSQHSAAWLAQLQPSVGEKTRVIHNGFNFPSSVSQKEGFSTPAQILVLGRINARKGQDTAIRAIALLVARGVRVNLRIVGAPFRGYEEILESLKELVEELQVSGHVTFVGEVEDPQTEIRSADVVVVPSLIESFGNVAVESMAQSRPVIASKIGGLSEIVDHEVSGLLYEPGDVRALAEAIERLLNDAPYAAKLAREGKAFAQSRFSIQRFNRDFSDVLRQLTS